MVDNAQNHGDRPAKGDGVGGSEGLLVRFRNKELGVSFLRAIRSHGIDNRNNGADPSAKEQCPEHRSCPIGRIPNRFLHLYRNRKTFLGGQLPPLEESQPAKQEDQNGDHHAQGFQADSPRREIQAIPRERHDRDTQPQADPQPLQRRQRIAAGEERRGQHVSGEKHEVGDGEHNPQQGTGRRSAGRGDPDDDNRKQERKAGQDR